MVGTGPLSEHGLRSIPVPHAGNTNASAEETECVAGLIRELLGTDAVWVDILRRNLWREQLEASGLNAGGFWTRTTVLTHGERPEAASGATPGRRRLTVDVHDEAAPGDAARGRAGRERAGCRWPAGSR